MRSHEPSTARTRTLATRHLSSRSPPAPVVLDRYRLQRRLGAGAFGTVWLARDERLERDVAVKILPRERVMSGRFEREARAAARLSHPAIVTLYEAAVDDEGAYLVSELVRGATLDTLLEHGQLSDRDIVAIGLALCDALQHAHDHGVVHRDVKPSNVLVPEAPPSSAQVAKLTDFGVARVVGGDALTHTGDVLGTLAYMAPEQADGLEAAEPADLYSVALVIYEALSGVNPVAYTRPGRAARRLAMHVPPLRRQRRDLPRDLAASIDLALRPRPRERGTLAELRRALALAQQQVGDEPGVVTGAWTTLRPGGDDEDAAGHEDRERLWRDPEPGHPGGHPTPEDEHEHGPRGRPRPCVAAARPGRPRRRRHDRVAGADRTRALPGASSGGGPARRRRRPVAAAPGLGSAHDRAGGGRRLPAAPRRGGRDHDRDAAPARPQPRGARRRGRSAPRRRASASSAQRAHGRRWRPARRPRGAGRRWARSGGSGCFWRPPLSGRLSTCRWCPVWHPHMSG